MKRQNRMKMVFIHTHERNLYTVQDNFMPSKLVNNYADLWQN